MKHLKVLFLLPLILCLLGSCESMPAKGILPVAQFTASFSAQSKDFCFEGTVTAEQTQGITLSVTAPENIKGFTVTYQNGMFTYDVLGVTDQTPAQEISNESPLKQLALVLYEASFSEHGQMHRQADEIFTELTACEQQYIFYWDKTGLPQRFTGSDLTVCFTYA